MHGRGEDPLSFEPPSRRADHAGSEMRGPTRIDDDQPLPSEPQVEPMGAQGGDETGAVAAPVPRSEGRTTHGIEGDAGALLQPALPWSEAGDRTRSLRASGSREPVGDIRTPLRSQAAFDRPGMLRCDRAHAELELDDAADLLAAGEVPGQVYDAPRRAHEAVDAVLVPSAVLDVHGPAVGLLRHSELGLEQRPPPRPGPCLIGDSRVRIDVDMVDGAVGSTAERHGHELAHLRDQVCASESPCRDNRDFLVVGFQEMKGECIADPAPAHGAGDHRPACRIRIGMSRPRARSRPARAAGMSFKLIAAFTDASSRTAVEIATTSSLGRMPGRRLRASTGDCRATRSIRRRRTQAPEVRPSRPAAAATASPSSRLIRVTKRRSSVGRPEREEEPGSAFFAAVIGSMASLDLVFMGALSNGVISLSRGTGRGRQLHREQEGSRIHRRRGGAPARRAPAPPCVVPR